MHAFGPASTRIPEWIHAFQAQPRHGEPPSCRLLAELGHPSASAYRRVRDFYENFTWTGRIPTARLLAAAPGGIYAELTEPRIAVRWVPGLLPGFGLALPTGEAYLDYLRAVAEAGFPEPTRPYAMLGRWHLGCPGEELRSRLSAALEAQGLVFRPCDDQVVLDAHGDPFRWDRIRYAAEGVYATWSLPPRPADYRVAVPDPQPEPRPSPAPEPRPELEARRPKRKPADAEPISLF